MCTFTSTGYMCRKCNACVRFEWTEKLCDKIKSKSEDKYHKCVGTTVHERKSVSEDQCDKCKKAKKDGTKREPSSAIVGSI
ncbi:hypothetical protein ACHAPT_010638 [Fusarium lateritium]